MVLKSSSTGSISWHSRSEAGQGVFYRVTAMGYPESLSHTFSLVTILEAISTLSSSWKQRDSEKVIG